jgi:ABC-2 type transport system permease protein
MSTAWAIGQRTWYRYRRTPQTMVMPVAQAVSFLLIFRYVFGGAIETGGQRYVDYMVPGLVTVSAMFAAMGTAIGVADDLRRGVFDRVRSLPVPRAAVLAGRAVADTGLVAVVLAVTAAVAFATGFRLHGGWLPGLAAFGMCVLFGLVFVWVFITLGLLTGNAQAAGGIGFLVLPLSFASSAYVPVGSMPGWLRGFAVHQPVTVTIDAVRALAGGQPAGGSVTGALLWAAAIIAGCVSVSVVRFQRRD